MSLSTGLGGGLTVVHRSSKHPSGLPPACAVSRCARANGSIRPAESAGRGSGWGDLRTKQALLLGLSRESVRRLARDDHWQRLTPGVFYLGVGDPSVAGAGLGRESCSAAPAPGSGSMRQVTSGACWTEPPEECQVLVPVDRQVAARGCWTFPRERPGVRRKRSAGDPPCTTIADTAIDLCASVDEPDIEDVLTRAVQRTTGQRAGAPAVCPGPSSASSPVGDPRAAGRRARGCRVGPRAALPERRRTGPQSSHGDASAPKQQRQRRARRSLRGVRDHRRTRWRRTRSAAAARHAARQPGSGRGHGIATGSAGTT